MSNTISIEVPADWDRDRVASWLSAMAGMVEHGYTSARDPDSGARWTSTLDGRGVVDNRGVVERSPFENAPRPPLSMKEERANALQDHMAEHEGRLLTEYANGDFTLTYSWVDNENNWRGWRNPEGRATVQARSPDLLGTMQCVIAQVDQGIEFHPFDAGLADFSDPAVRAAADQYYAGPFCSCGDYSCPRSADENARCVNSGGLYEEVDERSATREVLVIDPVDRADSGLRDIDPKDFLNGYQEIGRYLTPGDGPENEVVLYGNEAPNDAQNGPGTALLWHYNRGAMRQFVSGPVVILGGRDGEGWHSVPLDAIETYGDIVTGRYRTGFDVEDYAVPGEYEDDCEVQSSQIEADATNRLDARYWLDRQDAESDRSYGLEL